MRPGKNRDDLPFPTALVDNGRITELFHSEPADINALRGNKLFFERAIFEVSFAPDYKAAERFEGTILDGLTYINAHFEEDE